VSGIYSAGEADVYELTSSRYDGELHPRPELVEYLKEYAREKPEVAALWCFAVGFVLGWKLKPW
jgi:hypothetical protein